MSTIPHSFVKEFPGPEIALAEWTYRMKRSVLREMLAVVSRPGILSFAGGLPDPALFPVNDFAEAVSQVLASDAKALQYGPPFLPLKRHIVSLMAKRSVICSEDQILITTGAQQALNMLTHLFLNDGGQVLVEELVYSGIQQAIAPFNPDILTVTTDLQRGMDVDMVEAYLLAGCRPSFLYAISEAHNPLGVSLSQDRQQQLLALARQYGLPIIEDDPYGLLCYEPSAATPMRALEEEWVFYVGSFSKILAPALRLGWMVAPEFLIPKLTVIKESSDLETSAFIQRSVAAYIDAGHLPAHLDRLRQAYRLRRDTMLQAMARTFPLSARWTRPTGGMFIWVELPGHVDTTELLWQAVEELQVAFIPGTAFEATAGSTRPVAGRKANNCMRLNFSNCSPNTIEEGIGRLGTLLHKYC